MLLKSMKQILLFTPILSFQREQSLQNENEESCTRFHDFNWGSF